MKRLGVVLLILAVFGLLLAGCANDQPLTVGEAWARPAITGGNGGVFFVIDNTGQSQNDTLIAAQTDICEKTELHRSMMDGNVMKMEPQETVEVAAKTKVDFKPGGLHVMLINLNQDLKKGDTFKLTLQFEKAGPVSVQVSVLDQ